MPSNKKKGAHKISKEEKHYRRTLADQRHISAAKIASILSEGILSAEASQLFSKIGYDTYPDEPVSVATDAVKKLAKLAGTNLDINENDPYGDGDQSPVGEQNPSGEEQTQILGSLFSVGGDLYSYLSNKAFNTFGMACVAGIAEIVLSMLHKAPREERIHLLECRHSGMRITPLIMTIAFSKVAFVPFLSNHLEVVKVLLQYGARPDAKEITGKTVAHYGAGCYATPDTLKMVDVCCKAYQTSHCFGKKVVLRNMKSQEFNGATGTLGGYIADSKRRQVILDHKKGKYAIPPTNIFVISEKNSAEYSIIDTSRNLLNIQDRMGTTSLHEVFNYSRTDVADFLIERHVSIDLEDGFGRSVSNMAFKTHLTTVGISQMSQMIRDYAFRMFKEKMNRCWSCKRTSENLYACSRCKHVSYCSRECQKEHWLEHKADCKPPNDYFIQIQRPKFEWNGLSYVGCKIQSFATGISTPGFIFKRPDGVKPNELFWIKVQCISILRPLLVYDKTRSVLFYLMPDEPGHTELFNKVSQEKSFNGKKAFFEASFDSGGTMKVYPNSISMKSW